MRPDRDRDSLYHATTEVSAGLKAAAKAHDVGVLALAQLSREVERRTNKRPILSDLRDSGSIEQDADAIVFLYREEYYLRMEEPEMASIDRPKWDAAMDEVRGRIDMIVAKRRNGETGTARCLFDGAFMAVSG